MLQALITKNMENDDNDVDNKAINKKMCVFCTDVFNVTVTLHRRDTVDHLGPLLQTCKSEMLRAEVRQKEVFKHVYEQDSQTTVGTTLSKLALEARVQKKRFASFVYKQPASPISIPSTLFPGRRMEG